MPRSNIRSRRSATGKGETFGVVDALDNSRQELMERAKELRVRGFTKMTKKELGRAIKKKQKAA